MAADYALALLAESLSAFLCGIFMDTWPNYWTANRMSILMGCSSWIFTLAWLVYHQMGGGAASLEASNMTQLTQLDHSDPNQTKQTTQKKTNQTINQQRSVLSSKDIRASLLGSETMPLLS